MDKRSASTSLSNRCPNNVEHDHDKLSLIPFTTTLGHSNIAFFSVFIDNFIKNEMVFILCDYSGS